MGGQVQAVGQGIPKNENAIDAVLFCVRRILTAKAQTIVIVEKWLQLVQKRGIIRESYRTKADPGHRHGKEEPDEALRCYER